MWTVCSNPRQYTLDKTIDLNQIREWSKNVEPRKQKQRVVSQRFFLFLSWFGVCREEVRDLKSAEESGDKGLPPPLPPQLLPAAKVDFDAPDLVWSDEKSVPRYDTCFKVRVIGWLISRRDCLDKNIMLSHTHHNDSWHTHTHYISRSLWVRYNIWTVLMDRK